MDILILYEHAERELYNAYLIKFELEKRGYEVEILNCMEPVIPYFKKPLLVLTPWMYTYRSFDCIKSKFIRKVDKILNLQYEQILSEVWLEAGHHLPSGYGKNVCHICFSDLIKNRLEEVGVDESHLFITGDIRCDFTKDRFKSFHMDKKELAEEFNLSKDKEWILFISSFAFTNPVDEIKNNIQKYVGIENANYIEYINNISQKEIIKWIKKFIERHPDKEFIYRPHPSEYEYCSINNELIDLIENYDNFHFIFKYSVQDWILNSDFINTWFSTSLTEIFQLKKSCNILRPVNMDPRFDVPFYINAKFVDNYEEFEKLNLKSNNEFPISKEELNKYYEFDEEYSYIKICNAVEYIIKEDKFKQNFYKNPVLYESLKCLFETIFSKNILKSYKNKIDTKKLNKLKKIVNNE